MGNCFKPSSTVQNGQSNRNNANPSEAPKRILSSSTSPNQQDTERIHKPVTESDLLPLPDLKFFAFCDLRTATGNFRPSSLLGEGGFGFVYKGWIDEHTFAPSKHGSGTVIAVKKLKPDSYQGHKEWLAEINYLGQLRHPNLVKLIGCCSEGDNRLLVYEFMAKGSLENHLFRTTRGSEPLSWATRIKVAIDAARGLTFLHDAESQVIYRDFKASNILLDSDFNAKLSDFGLAKAGPTGDQTHVTTQIMGTPGYAAPEYLATGRLSAKADVYSFGVVLLELLSGCRAYDHSRSRLEQNLVDWMRPCLGDRRRFYRIMDPRLEGMYPKKGAGAFAVLAQQCLREDPKLRPCMSEVLTALEEIKDANLSQGQQRTRARGLLYPGRRDVMIGGRRKPTR